MRLATRIGVGLVAAGIAVGSLSACSSSSTSSSSSSSTSVDPSAALASIPSLTGVSTAVTLDAGFLGALKTLGLTPAPLGTATLDGTTGVISFPITGGNVKYYNPAGPVQPFVVGEIDHNGSGLSLTAGSTVVKLENFIIDPGSASELYGQVTVNGTVAFPKAPLFDLDGTTLKALQVNTDGTAVLEGTTVKLSATAASALNKVFKTTAVKAGLVIGIAKITVNTK